MFSQLASVVPYQPPFLKAPLSSVRPSVFRSKPCLLGPFSVGDLERGPLGCRQRAWYSSDAKLSNLDAVFWAYPLSEMAVFYVLLGGG